MSKNLLLDKKSIIVFAMQDKTILKQKFLKIYSNLPIPVREEIVVSLPKIGPLTWNACYTEVENNTENAKKIIDDLDELKIL